MVLSFAACTRWRSSIVGSMGWSFARASCCVFLVAVPWARGRRSGNTLELAQCRREIVNQGGVSCSESSCVLPEGGGTTQRRSIVIPTITWSCSVSANALNPQQAAGKLWGPPIFSTAPHPRRVPAGGCPLLVFSTNFRRLASRSRLRSPHQCPGDLTLLVNPDKLRCHDKIQRFFLPLMIFDDQLLARVVPLIDKNPKATSSPSAVCSQF